MTIKIKFFAQFRDVFGSEIRTDLVPGENLLDLTRRVASMKKGGVSILFSGTGSLQEFVILMRNGKRIGHSDASHTLVADGDEIAIFPPVAGG